MRTLRIASAHANKNAATLRFTHSLSVRSKVKMGFFAKTIGRFAFLLSCLRLSRSRGTSTTPPTQDEEAETVPTVEVAPLSESSEEVCMEQPSAESVSLMPSTRPTHASPPPEPRPCGSDPTLARGSGRRQVPFWMRPKSKEAEDLPRHRDSAIGSVSRKFSSCCGRANGMSFSFSQNSSGIGTVQLESLVLLSNRILGRVTVANLALEKAVHVRWTSDDWSTFTDTPCEFQSSDVPAQRDCFTFEITIAGAVELCVSYAVHGHTYWDNNSSQNYSLPTKVEQSMHYCM